MKKTFLLIAGLLLGVAHVHALDQERFADLLMKFWSLDTRDSVTVTKPIPSQYGNLLVATATIRNNQYPVYLTPDERYFFWGHPVDAVKDPDKARWAEIQLTGVRSKGSVKAPVTIVEYSSYQCSHCRHAHMILSEKLYKTYTKEQVRWVAKNFPLEGNDWAQEAAIAAECAGRQSEDAFWKMGELIFSTDTIHAENVKSVTANFAQKLKLNMAQYEQCYDNKEPLEKIKADKLEGTRAGVNSTPTFFINGRMKRGFREFDDIKVVIDEKLSEIK